MRWRGLRADVSVEQAMVDPGSLVRSLAMADARFGKRPLAAVDESRLYRLAAQILRTR